MSISTKTGDKGKTGLWSNERVWKDDERVEAYGTIDELNSFIGDAKHTVKNEKTFHLLEKIQNDLFKVAGQLATKGKPYIQPIHDDDVETLTNWVHEFESEVKLTGFVIPGSTVSSARLDICRTIARRAERRIITLSHKEEIPEELIRYVNRLSDLFFIMGRKEEAIEGKINKKNWE